MSSNNKGLVKPIAVDLFSGVGGMSLGFERSGFDVALAVDHDPIHIDTYARNFPFGRVLRSDLRELRGSDVISGLGEGQSITPDVVFGGPPCQGFSYGGKHKVGDPRNELLAHFGRLIGEIRPKYFVMENVAGLTSQRMISHLEAFVETVETAGYSVSTPIKINAADFGVPQQRFRVFVVGQLSGLEETGNPAASDARATVWDAIGDLPNIESFDYLTTSDVLVDPLGQSPSTYASGLRSMSAVDEVGRTPHNESALSGCARTKHSESSRKRFASTPPGTFEPVSRFYRLAKDGVARTLRAGSDSSRGAFTAPRPIHPIYARCISVREAARLHGFPDWFQFHPTKWHGFRQIGNAVPPPLASAVGDSVYAALVQGGSQRW